MYFLGYSPNQKSYKCYSPTSKNFSHSFDVTFSENELSTQFVYLGVYSRKKIVQIENQQESVQNKPVHDSSTRSIPNNKDQGTTEIDDRPITLRKRTRTCTQNSICNFLIWLIVTYVSFVCVQFGTNTCTRCYWGCHQGSKIEGRSVWWDQCTRKEQCFVDYRTSPWKTNNWVQMDLHSEI